MDEEVFHGVEGSGRSVPAATPGGSPDAPRQEEVCTFSRCFQAPRGTESLDYDLHETDQGLSNLAAQRQSLANKCCLGRIGRGGARWLAVCVAGVGAGLTAMAIDQSLTGLFALRHHMMHRLEDVAWPGQYFAFVGFSLTLVAVAGVLVCLVEPLAAGSGIPEIKCFLNGVDVPRVLLPLTYVCKALGIVMSVGAGLPCGKEGPMIHCGAIMGSLVSYAFSGPLSRPISLMREQRDLVAAGAAAGVAAAFSAPLGGVLFAIEEGASHMSPAIMMRTFVCSSVAALVVRFCGGGFAGLQWGKLGHDGYPLAFGSLPDLSYHVFELPVFALVAALAGLAGALYNALNMRLSRFRKRYVGVTGPVRLLEVLVVAAVITSSNYFFPLWFAGRAEKIMESPNLLTFFWEDESQAIQLITHAPAGAIPLVLLLVFCVKQYAFACWTYGLGVPSGLFVPSLLLGGCFGRLVGEGMYAMGALSTPEAVGGYALVGAASMLAGVARITISLSVILMESVGNQTFGIPLFLGTLVAKWVADTFNQGLYDLHIELKHVPLLEPSPEKEMLTLSARDIMEKDVVAFRPVETVQSILAALKSCEHHGFPVTDAHGLFVGLVRRSTLQHVLACGRDFGIFQEPGKELAGTAPLLPYEGRALRHDDFATLAEASSALIAEDYDHRVDLMPFVNRGCYTVPQHANVMRCYALFRTLGLRHLPVVGKDFTLRGMITRKDLILAHAHRRKWRPLGTTGSWGSSKFAAESSSSEEFDEDGDFSNSLEDGEGEDGADTERDRQVPGRRSPRAAAAD